MFRSERQVFCASSISEGKHIFLIKQFFPLPRSSFIKRSTEECFPLFSSRSFSITQFITFLELHFSIHFPFRLNFSGELRRQPDEKCKKLSPPLLSFQSLFIKILIVNRSIVCSASQLLLALASRAHRQEIDFHPEHCLRITPASAFERSL